MDRESSIVSYYMIMVQRTPMVHILILRLLAHVFLVTFGLYAQVPFQIYCN